MSAIWSHAGSQWRAMRRDFQDVLEAEYARAVDETAGNMVNARGRAKGVTSMDVFTGSWNIVAAYASDELKEHLRLHPRTTLQAFERYWLEEP